MLNYFYKKKYYKCQKVSETLLSEMKTYSYGRYQISIIIIIQFGILVVTWKLRESYYLDILKLYDSSLWFLVHITHYKELRFSRDYYVKNYPEQHQFACH